MGVALEALPEARPVQPTILVDKDIGPEIEPEKKEQKEQYKVILQVQNNSVYANAVSPQMAQVICYNVPGFYQHKADRLLKKITEHADIITRNNNE